MQSEIGDTSRIVISGNDIEKGYENSLLDWVKVLGKSEFDLAGRYPGRGVFTFVIPKDTPSGSYHGDIVFQAFNPETKKLTDEKKVPVSIIVGKEHNYDIEFRSLNYIKDDEGYLLSLDIKNSSNIQIAPKANITITDDKLKIEKQLIGTISQKEYQMSKVKRFQKAEKIFSSKNFKIKVNRRPIQSEYHTNDHYQITFIYDRRRIKFARYMEEFEVGLSENKVKEKFNL